MEGISPQHKPRARFNQCSFAAVLPRKDGSCVGLSQLVLLIEWVLTWS